MIDEMARLGLPPGNPFFGEAAQPRGSPIIISGISARPRSRCAGVSGWEADAALTWFSAFASLMLMMGLAVGSPAGRPRPLGAAVRRGGVAAHDACLLFAPNRFSGAHRPATGFAGWLFQAAWVPQHLISATCVVLAILLMAVRAGGTPLLVVAICSWSCRGLRKLDLGRRRHLRAGRLVAGTGPVSPVEGPQRLPFVWRVRRRRGDWRPVWRRRSCYDHVPPPLRGSRRADRDCSRTKSSANSFLKPCVALLDLPAYWLVSCRSNSRRSIPRRDRAGMLARIAPVSTPKLPARRSPLRRSPRRASRSPGFWSARSAKQRSRLARRVPGGDGADGCRRGPGALDRGARLAFAAGGRGGAICLGLPRRRDHPRRM